MRIVKMCLWLDKWSMFPLFFVCWSIVWTIAAPFLVLSYAIESYEKALRYD